MTAAGGFEKSRERRYGRMALLFFRDKGLSTLVAHLGSPGADRGVPPGACAIRTPYRCTCKIDSK